VGDLSVKPSRVVNVGEIIKVRKTPITKSLKVLALSGKRMGAKLIVDFVEDVTPPEEMELLEMQKHMRWSSRDKGAGRPTKKDRRELDDFFDL
jgi:ribosome-associated heat shock protein Hsp15